MNGIPRRLAIAVLTASATQLGSCNDGLLHESAPASAPVSISASVSRSAGGNGEAFDRADRIFVRFRAGDVVRLEQELPFAPSAAETVVRVDVPLRRTTEAMSGEIELRLGDRVLFRGATSSTLSAGAPTPMNFVLEPVVAAVTCGTGQVQLASYGQTTQLSGAALFASGDTVRDVPVIFSTAANGAVSASDAGLVTALQDGDAAVACSAGGASATRSVRVFGVVASVQVAPPTATLVAGSSLTFVATLLDARGNVISTPRPLTWSSNATGVASVTAVGVVAGVLAGSARIDATSGGVAGSAVVTVVSPSTVVTNAATGITGTTATLLGSVNPRGVATQAFFEYATDPALANPTSTATQQMGSGNAAVSLAASVAGLTPNTTYFFRAVASSVGGTVRGATLSFRTPQPPTAVTLSLDTSTTQSYTVRGIVTAFGSPTVAWFEFGTSSTLSTFTVTAQQSVGSASTATPISQALGGLPPSTTIFFRAAASNVGGTAKGTILSFRTGSAPSVTTLGGTLLCSGAGTVPICSVNMSGTVNPNGALTDGWFEFGSSATLTSFSSTSRQRLGSGTTPLQLEVRNMPVSVPFFLRAVAQNASGLTRGAIFQASSPVQ